MQSTTAQHQDVVLRGTVARSAQGGMTLAHLELQPVDALDDVKRRQLQTGLSNLGHQEHLRSRPCRPQVCQPLVIMSMHTKRAQPHAKHRPQGCRSSPGGVVQQRCTSCCCCKRSCEVAHLLVRGVAQHGLHICPLMNTLVSQHKLGFQPKPDLFIAY